MSFEPVNELERLLMAAPSDPSARPAFYRALLEHELLLVTDPAHSPPVIENGMVQPGSTIAVKMIEIDGRPHATIFSAEQRLAAVAPGEGMPFVAMKGRDVFELLKAGDIVLNPGSDFGKYFPPHEVASMLDGSIFVDAGVPRGPGGHRQIDVGGRRCLLGQPANYPRQLTDALAVFFATVPTIRAAYLAHGSVEGADAGQGPHSMIGIETDGDWSALVQSLGPVLEANTKPNEVIDLVKVTRASDDVIASYMIKQTTPFYRAPRKKWLGLF